MTTETPAVRPAVPIEPAQVGKATAGGLSSAASDRFSHLHAHDLRGLVTDVVPHTCMASDSVVDQMGRLADELAEWFERYGPTPVAIDRFLAGAPAWEDRLDRWAVLHLFELLPGGDPHPSPWPEWLRPSTKTLKVRPLRPLELALVGLVARGDVRQLAVVGAVMAGCDSGELAHLYSCHVELDEAGEPIAFALPGEPPTRCGPTPVVPRSAPIHEWAVPAIRQRLDPALRDQGRPLLYDGRSEDPHKVQSTILMTVGKVLRLSGLAGDPSVAPRSVRLGAALERWHTTGSIESAAGLLGLTDLGKVQRQLGLL